MNDVNFKTGFVNNQEYRDWLIAMLQDDVMIVTFTKKDGTEREMKCTLSENKIPNAYAPKGAERAKPVESIAVFDLDKNEWRSFRWDSVKTVDLGA